MKVTIQPGIVNGTITAPSSKSMMQRACAAALLHHGTTIINNPGFSDDDTAALNIIQQLGATIVSKTKERIEIKSNGINPISDTIHCGESGLSTRLFTPIASLSDRPIHITGHGTLLKRSMDSLINMLTTLGVSITSDDNKLPITVQGPLQPKSILIDGASGSQALSGLLFAYAFSVKEPTIIEVRNLKSIPYIALTLQVLQQFGRTVTHDDYKTFHIDPALFTHQPTIQINIEGDWSSAAFMLVAGAIAGEVTVNNITLASTQADKKIIEVLQQAYANVSIEDNSVTVKRSLLHSFDVDATHCPDLFPILAILAACCDGDSNITGVHRLFDKESNRVESVCEMLENFNVHFSVENDILCITGEDKLQSTIIDSYHDHRIAMAASVGALRANNSVVIEDAQVVNKSYPDFFKDLDKIGTMFMLE